MSGVYPPDLTGANESYLVTNKPFRIFNTNQRIEFEGPVFLEGLVAVKIGTVNETLVYGTDYDIVEATDLDYTSMAEMRAYDPQFTKKLIKSIRFIRTATDDTAYLVHLTFQCLWPSRLTTTLFGTASTELNPDLLQSLLERVNVVEQLTQDVTDSSAVSTSTPRLLEYDINKENTDNFITDQIYTVNTLSGKNSIFPLYGPFFGDSVTVKLVDEQTVLTRNVDYLLLGEDLSLIKATSNTGGIYKYILFTTAFVGNVSVNCHYVGGEVAVSDVSAVYTNIVNVINFLNDKAFVTSDTIGATTPFKELLTRMISVEDQMRALLIANAGSNVYGDTTNNTTKVWKFRSVDTDLHWWTIATLYQVSGSTTIVTADRMEFRIKLSNSGLMADVGISVNLDQDTPFVIDAWNVHQDLGYQGYTSVDTVPVMMPQFRVLYNQAKTGGISLQIGLALINLNETVAIEDLSGVESCWKLSTPSATAVTPQDNSIALPSGSYTWDSATATSLSAKHMMPNKTGYLAWNGAMAVTDMSNSLQNFEHLLEDSFYLSDVHTLRAEFVNGSGVLSTLLIPVGVGPSSTYRTGVGYLPSSIAGSTPIPFRASLSRNTSSAIVLSLTPETVPFGTTLTLRQLHVMV